MKTVAAGALFGCMILGASAPAEAQTAQDAGSCKVVTATSGSVEKESLYCQQPDGSWKSVGEMMPSPQQSTTKAAPNVQSSTLSDDWRGHITYHGSYRGQVTVPAKEARVSRRSGGGINLNIPDLLGTLGGGNTQPIGGDFTADLEIDGQNVTLNTRSSGGLNPDTERGTRQGDQCVFPESNGTLSARCSRDEFVAQFYPADGAKPKIEFTASTRMTNIVDRAEQERQQAVAKAEQERKAAEFAAYLKSRPPADKVAVDSLRSAIAQDSTAWVSNRYDSSSLRDVIVLNTSPDGTKTLRGNYTYNGGASGWVQGQIKGGSVQCLEYWDFAGTCSPVRRRSTSVTNRQTLSDKHWKDVQELARKYGIAMPDDDDGSAALYEKVHDKSRYDEEENETARYMATIIAIDSAFRAEVNKSNKEKDRIYAIDDNKSKIREGLVNEISSGITGAYAEKLEKVRNIDIDTIITYEELLDRSSDFNISFLEAAHRQLIIGKLTPNMMQKYAETLFKEHRILKKTHNDLIAINDIILNEAVSANKSRTDHAR